MAVRKVLKIGKHQKVLETKSEAIHKFNRETKALIQDLKDTVADNPAVGLAAPQIGVLKRAFAVLLGYYDRDEEDETPPPPPVIMINPEIIESENPERGFDACLSIPGMMGYTDRATKIRVKYLDEQGKKQDRVFENWDARMIQHEQDHLDGILFTSRLKTLDDLFVYVTNADGETEAIPYPEFIKTTTTQAVEKPILPNRTELA